MELNHLRSFVAVAKLGHLTRAAETLHLSQPALSGQIKALEEHLGVTLFERLPSGMALTPSGRQLLPEAEQIIGAVQQLKNAAQGLRGQPTGTLKLGTVLDPAFLRVGELLARTLERYPQIELQLHQVVSSDALAKVRSGELDASFYFGPSPEPELRCVALREITYRVALPIAWADDLVTASWETVAQRPWILTPELSSHRQLVLELFRDRGGLPERTIEADNESVITNLIESDAARCGPIQCSARGYGCCMPPRGTPTRWLPRWSMSCAKYGPIPRSPTWRRPSAVPETLYWYGRKKQKSKRID